MNLSAIAIITVGSLYIGLGITVILRNFQKIENRTFLALALAAAIWTFTNLPPLADTPIEFAICLISYSAAALLTFLIIQFIFLLTHRQLSKPLFYIEVPLIILSGIPGVVATGVSSTAIHTTPLLYAYALLLFTNLGMAVGSLVLFMRRAKGIARERASVISAGFIMSALGGLFFNLVLPLLGKSYNFVAIGPVFSVFLLLAIAFSIINHRLFEIKVTILRTLTYVVLLLAFGITYSWLIIGVGSNLLNNIGYSSYVSFFQIIMTLLIAVSFRPIRRTFDKLTNKIFFRDSYDTRTVLDALGSVLVKTVSLKELCRRSLAIVTTHVKSRYALLIINERAHGNLIISTGQKLPDTAALHQIIERGKLKAMTILDEFGDKTTGVIRDLIDADVAIIARLHTPTSSIGYLILSEKSNGSAYSDQDVSLIRIASDELSVAIQNALRFDEIERFNETLQQEVLSATEQLRSTNKKLRALDKAKDEFISIASHQLRTPLTSVKGHLSMLLDGDAGPLNEHQYQLAKDTYTSADRMAFLITDLLNVSRLKDGSLTIALDPVDLPQLIQDEVEQLAVAAQARDLTIETHLPQDFPLILLDIGKIRQVIMNFIDNAIFYSRVGGIITITLRRQAECIELTVQDTGIGVPIDEQPHIFSKFFRASNARYVRPDGTGIGLFAASKIVAAHNGAMIFESKENKGSTFGFSIPLHRADGSKQAAGSLKNKPAHK